MNWRLITDLGDSAVMVPMALLIAVWLLASRARRGALVWLALFGAGAFVVVSTKIAFLGWGIGIRLIDFTGVSGHSMTAAATLTIAGYLAGDRYSNSAAIVGAGLGCLLAVMIAISRVVLGIHSTSEVTIGCILGYSVALTSIVTVRASPRDVAVPIVFIFALLAFIITVHGRKAPSEHLMVKIALYLSGRTTPYRHFAD